jgi:hypothetical protein
VQLFHPLNVGAGMEQDHDFRVLTPIEHIETIAIGRAIRELKRLRKKHGGRRWRKKKGEAFVEFYDDGIVLVELHWYEAHGVGRRELKVKRTLE